MENRTLTLGFLASHNGTDMQAIVGEIQKQHLNAKAAVVISNNSASPSLEFARSQNPPIPSFHISSRTHENPDLAMTQLFLDHGVELVIFSGFMKVLKEDSPLLKAFNEKIWNPHPADTKKYGGFGMYGDAVHEAVLKAGEAFTLPTIHIVNGSPDGGKILAQGKVKINSDETIESLKPRVQKEEIRLFLELLHDKTG